MKKTFKLNTPNKHPARLLEAIKYDVRKYVKRERNKQLPVGAHYWAFDCRFGEQEAQAQAVHLGDLNKLMDQVATAGGEQFYIEILARAAVRTPREADADAVGDDAEDEDLEG